MSDLVERLRNYPYEVCDWRTGNTRCKEYRERIKELEAKLQRVEALPDTWRKKKPIDGSDYYILACEHCAAELREILGEQE